MVRILLHTKVDDAARRQDVQGVRHHLSLQRRPVLHKLPVQGPQMRHSVIAPTLLRL